MSTMDTSCLYSTVKNTSGVRMTFGFLPPHGRTLNNNEEFTVIGDIRQSLGGNQGGESSVKRRAYVAFEAAVESGKLTILNTPAGILQDTVTDDNKMLQLANGTLSAVDPCWTVSIAP